MLYSEQVCRTADTFSRVGYHPSSLSPGQSHSRLFCPSPGVSFPSSITVLQCASHSRSTNCLSFSLIVTLLSAYFSDKYQNRSIPTILVVLLCVVGFSINLRKSPVIDPLSLSAHAIKLFYDQKPLRTCSYPYDDVLTVIFVSFSFYAQAQATNLSHTALCTLPYRAYTPQLLSSPHGWLIILNHISVVQLVLLLDLLLPIAYVITAS